MRPPVSLLASIRLSASILGFALLCGLLSGSAEADLSNLKVTEIHYHPPDAAGIVGTELEFFEMKNTGNVALDVSEATFTSGIQYRFPPDSSVDAAGFIVLASNQAAFLAVYGFSALGAYEGQLSNGGERIRLADAAGVTIFTFEYDDNFNPVTGAWPTSPDGDGYSLVARDANPAGDPGMAEYWRPSSEIGGSPGQDDPASETPAPLLVNEILTHTDLPQVDVIEIYNPTENVVDLTGWTLTDDESDPTRYSFLPGTKISPMSYLVLLEDDDGDPLTTPGPNYFGSAFGLNSHGEDIYLYSPDQRYKHGFSFDAAENMVSFGRYINSDGVEQFPPQLVNSFGAANVGPKTGSVVISEILYHAPEGYFSFIEIVNRLNKSIPLFDPDFPENAWEVGGVGFSFPPGVSIRPGEEILLIEPTVTPSAFAAQYGVPAGVQIFNYPGNLQQGSETLTIRRPDRPDEALVPYIEVDKVKYDDNFPWPEAPDGNGPSLERIDRSAYGNESVNWKASEQFLGTPASGMAQSPDGAYWLLR